MTIGLLIAAALFAACALAGERHMLFVPAVVLLAVAAANAVAGPLLP